MIPNVATSQENLRYPEDYSDMETSFGTMQNSICLRYRRIQKQLKIFAF